MMDGDIFRVTIPLDDDVPAAGENVPVTEQVTPQVTPQVRNLVSKIDEEMKTSDLMKLLGLQDRKNFKESYLDVAIELGLIEMTQPDSPKSPTQKYRLTERGITFKKSMKQS